MRLFISQFWPFFLRILTYKVAILRYKLAILTFFLRILRYKVAILRYKLAILRYKLAILRYKLAILRYKLAILTFFLRILRYKLAILRYKLAIATFYLAILTFFSRNWVYISELWLSRTIGNHSPCKALQCFVQFAIDELYIELDESCVRIWFLNIHKNDSLFSISVFCARGWTVPLPPGRVRDAHRFQTQHSSFLYSSEFEAASIALF